ncbi:MAG: sugar phosphate isomerase/epimerase [Candidatus Omnitrophica bacterium]|nr:sugar phosphate isomerase/epimerase [Candidatus Omnitrophota bacterium]
MKKGINRWGFVERNIKECIKKAKEVGFESIELNLEAEGEITLASQEKELLEMKKFAADTGLEISSVLAALLWKYPLTSEDKTVAEKGKDVVKKAIEIASIFQADTVLVIPGVVGSVLLAPTEVHPYDTVYKKSQEVLKELAPFAREHQVYLGVENVWNKFLLSPTEMKNFIDEIDEEYVQAYFDVGNVLLYGYPEHWIRILGKRIKKVHFKDFRTAVGTLDGFVGLLHGDVNWKEVMAAFKEIGYDGHATAEYMPYKFHPEQLPVDISNAMDKILGRKK